jgi:16S rRNA (adenine(1408)-N(1))-methyltransferase
LTALIARHERVVVDIGTGTGQAVSRRARREPATLVIGVDAEASAMADASRQAARSPRRGGLANALFLVESAERLPGLLAGRADLVTVVLPWGSLLRAITAPDVNVVAGLRGLLRDGGELAIFLSDLTRADVERLTRTYESLCFTRVELREVTAADVAELSSGWARRLGIPGSRPAWIISLRR